jgi:hypothetical protein
MAGTGRRSDGAARVLKRDTIVIGRNMIEVQTN